MTAYAQPLSRRLAGEGLGSLLLAAAVVGSGIMAERLSGGNLGVALLANTAATVAVLAAFIALLGPVSGAHFNPAVSVKEAIRGRLAWRDTGMYAVTQIVGCGAGALIAHVMFELPLWQLSAHVRTGPAQWLAEGVATFGLLLVVLGCLDRSGVLVYGVNLIRKPGHHNSPLAHEHVLRYSTGRPAGVHRGAVRWCAWCSRSRSGAVPIQDNRSAERLSPPSPRDAGRHSLLRVESASSHAILIPLVHRAGRILADPGILRC
jgi:glycerol uptake facilitator-like aquaporin